MRKKKMRHLRTKSLKLILIRTRSSKSRMKQLLVRKDLLRSHLRKRLKRLKIVMNLSRHSKKLKLKERSMSTLIHGRQT